MSKPGETTLVKPKGLIRERCGRWQKFTTEASHASIHAWCNLTFPLLFSPSGKLPPLVNLGLVMWLASANGMQTEAWNVPGPATSAEWPVNEPGGCEAQRRESQLCCLRPRPRRMASPARRTAWSTHRCVRKTESRFEATRFWGAGGLLYCNR